jgi:hypothetical protein
VILTSTRALTAASGAYGSPGSSPLARGSARDDRDEEDDDLSTSSARSEQDSVIVRLRFPPPARSNEMSIPMRRRLGAARRIWADKAFAVAGHLRRRVVVRAMSLAIFVPRGTKPIAVKVLYVAFCQALFNRRSAIRHSQPGSCSISMSISPGARVACTIKRKAYCTISSCSRDNNLGSNRGLAGPSSFGS